MPHERVDVGVEQAAFIDVDREQAAGKGLFQIVEPNLTLVNAPLPAGHPFEDVQEAYRSSTTSMFEADWAWALYLLKGAVGVGRKSGAHFSVWAVRDIREKNSRL